MKRLVLIMAAAFKISGVVPEKPKEQVVLICDKNNVCIEVVVNGSAE